MHCTLIHQMLLLPTDRRSISMFDAKRNYRKIMKHIHPDKCREPDAAHAAKSLTTIWALISDTQIRTRYEMQGREGIESATDETIDWEALPSIIIYIERKVPASQRSHTSPTPEEVIIDETEEPTADEMTPDNTAEATSSSSAADESTNDSACCTSDDNPPKDEQHMEYEQHKTDTDNSEPRSPTFSNDSGNRRRSFKESIKEIRAHKKQRGQLKFLVIWQGFKPNEAMWEHEDYIFKEHPMALTGNLKQLKANRWKSFLALVRTNQHLGILIQ